MGNSRIKKLNRYFKEYGLDAFLITDLINIRYLTGFTGTNATLLVFNEEAFPREQPLFITDGRYTLQSKQETSGVRIEITSVAHDLVIQTCNQKGCGHIGFEAGNLTYESFSNIREKLDGEFVAVTRKVADLRVVKDESEIEATREAVNLATAGFKELRSKLKLGMSELDIKTELEYSLAKLGAAKMSFDTIVAVDGNAALPHAKPGDTKLKQGSSLLVDFGVFKHIYASDETITMYYGKPPNKFVEIYELVYEAQQAALDKIKAGVTAKEVDAAARNIIVKAGYGPNFNHNLGHSIGLEIHDGSRLGAQSEFALEEGMLFTVEPGVYIEGEFGVRLEDVVLITSNGYEKLTSLSKKLTDNILDL